MPFVERARGFRQAAAILRGLRSPLADAVAALLSRIADEDDPPEPPVNPDPEPGPAPGSPEDPNPPPKPARRARLEQIIATIRTLRLEEIGPDPVPLRRTPRHRRRR